jgi:integrase
MRRVRGSISPGFSEAKVREKAASLSERARAGDAVLIRKEKVQEKPQGEDVRHYAGRWVDERDARGLLSADDDRGRLEKHVLPLLSDRATVEVTRADLEAVVEDLDRKVREDEIAWLTARNVWACMRKMFSDASASKVREFRVRDDNPAAGVRGPDKGAEKAKVYLYPSEFLKLVSCEAVPLQQRRVYAFSVYLYVRAGELEALGLDDVDPERAIIHVHRAIDRERKIEKSTKGKQARRFSVEPEIAPLLRVIHGEAKTAGSTKLTAMPPVEDLSTGLREDLRLAGVDRAERFVSDKTRKNITFHDLRATGLTWMAVRGDDPLKIKHRAGHVDFSTTEIYIREAEQVRDGFGEVFPALPAAPLGEGTKNVPPDPPGPGESSRESSKRGGARRL